MSSDDEFDWAAYYNKSPERRDRWRTDLINRSRQVQRRGWAPYQYAWSTGETVAVAYLLGSRDVLEEMDETEETVIARWAFDLYGAHGGNDERAAGYPKTRQWFADTVGELAKADA